jgi:NTP pyrophosphatase (non-canonical NTP hydrolase)
MTPNEYQELSQKTEIPLYDTVEDRMQLLGRLLHAQLGITTEAGELADAIKKHVIYNQSLDEGNILEECGDLLWYISIALSSCGFTMEQCMTENIAKLKKRYPEKFTEQLAKERRDKSPK